MWKKIIRMNNSKIENTIEGKCNFFIYEKGVVRRIGRLFEGIITNDVVRSITQASIRKKLKELFKR